MPKDSARLKTADNTIEVREDQNIVGAPINMERNYALSLTTKGR